MCIICIAYNSVCIYGGYNTEYITLHTLNATYNDYIASMCVYIHDIFNKNYAKNRNGDA